VVASVTSPLALPRPAPPASPAFSRVLGRYALSDAIASGGMASVHLGRLVGSSGFTRTVAIKRLHESFAGDPEYVAMLLDEARLVGRIRHPNVVPTLDVVAQDGELWLVMEYVAGESLSGLLRRARAEARPTPIPIVVDVVASVLRGLHAAHEATSETGEALQIVHRDVSPQNVMVGSDGVSRVLDFGIAKAAGRMQHTRTGTIKGKVRYMAPEQVAGKASPASDIYSAAIVLWEALTGRRLFTGENDVEVMYRVVESRVEPPSRWRTDMPRELEAVVMRGLRKAPGDRFATARAMADALEAAAPAVTRDAVARWVEEGAGPELSRRRRRVAEIEMEATPPLGVPAPPARDAADPRDASTPGDVSGSRAIPAAAASPPAQASTLSALLPVSRVLLAPATRRPRVTTLLGAAAAAIVVAVLATRHAPAPTAPAATSAMPTAAVAGLAVPAVESPPAVLDPSTPVAPATPTSDVPAVPSPAAAAAAAPAPEPSPAAAAPPRPAVHTAARPAAKPPSDRIYRRD
jgi:hypothetical protein